MRTLCLIIAALLYVSVPSTLLADYAHTFTVRNYTLKFDWKHKLTVEHKDAFEIVGTVTGGTPCKKLEVQVAFSNDHYKDQVPVAKAYIENYKPGAKSEFRGEVPVNTSSAHIPSWGVIDYAVKCLE